MRNPSIWLAALSLVFAAPAALAQNDPYNGSHMWGWHGWFFGPLMMILFLGIIVVVVVMVLRGLGAGGGGQRSSSSNQALDILKERFARGEIDKAEYEERRRTLEQ